MKYYQNPILSGFHPDPSICRKGEDYYLVTSSFEYYPGLPIYHSRDLVHWRQIGHALNRLSQLPLQNAGRSGGIYAPTIRYHNGVFYIITTNISHRGNFVVTASDPSGDWTEPVWIEGAEGIDPSLFFDDDGRCYYTGNGNPNPSLYEGHHTIWLQEMDIHTMQLVGEKRIIVNGGTDISIKPVWIEGPHLYKKDGIYFLLAAEGGTEERHSVVVFRSMQITGPYESHKYNPMVTNRDMNPERPFPITCTGHADIIQTQRGEWWMVLLACRPYAPYENNHFNTGRETFLLPILWKNGWPVTVDETGNVQHTYPAPALPEHQWPDDYGQGTFSFSDTFDSSQLRMEWNIIRTPEEGFYNLTDRPGFLRISVRAEELGGTGAPSFVGIRQRHTNCIVTTAMEFRPKTINETAGIVVVQNNHHYYSMEYAMENEDIVLRLVRKTNENKIDILHKYPITGDRIWLRIICRGGHCSFLFAEEPDKWQTLTSNEDGTILSTRSAGGFVGVYLGVYASSHGHPSRNHADFDCFHYQGEDEDFLK